MAGTKSLEVMCRHFTFSQECHAPNIADNWSRDLETLFGFLSKSNRLTLAILSATWVASTTTDCDSPRKKHFDEQSDAPKSPNGAF